MMNATTADPPLLPNPFTPMAFLPPDLAYQSTISVYLSVGTLSVLIWDIISQARKDFLLMFHLPIKIPNLVYVLSRLMSFAFVLCLVIYQTAPLDIPCTRFSKVFTWLFAVSVPLTSLLFLFRVLAIFHENKLVRAFFCVMWLGVVAGVMTPTQGLIGTNIGPTKYCINVRLEAYITTAGLTPLVNDTLVFLAISWKLMRNTHMTPNPLRGNLSLRAFLRGDYLPAFSRGLLQDGQVYYLTTVTTNLMTVIVFYFTFIPAVYRAMFAVPNAALMNIMACRVYRRIKLACYKEMKNQSSNPPNSNPNDGPLIPLAFSPNKKGDSMTGLTGLEGIDQKKLESIDAMKTSEHNVGQCDDNLKGNIGL